MATAADLRRLALTLPGTIEASHFDRTAFKARRIYATLAADKLTANLMLTPPEQEFKCMMAPEAFSPVPGGWGRSGATTVTLAAIGIGELDAALRLAYAHAIPKEKSVKSRRR